MGKRLSEMTMEELWQLFPIRLTEHQSCWHEWFLEERAALRTALNGAEARISHIGSTAVEGIWAKPIVDLLVETAADDFVVAEQAALACGYRVMNRETGRISFNKGYTEEGFAERVFHLHLRVAGDCNEIYFREYLCAHPSEAKEYETLKLELWKKFEYNRDGYTNAKTDFITGKTEKAKSEVVMTNRHIFRPLGLPEVPVMFGMILDRIRWMDAKGIRHWNVTKYAEAYPIETYEEKCRGGLLHALTDIETGQLLAAGALLDADEYWPEDNVKAVYLHRFVSKIGSGGAGSAFMALAEDWARRRGAEYFRLDSADDNPPLARYYEEKGYQPAGTCVDGPYSGILRQKKL